MNPALELRHHLVEDAATTQLMMLMERVGFKRLDDTGQDEMGWIRVTGADRVRWLNGMVTNSIEELGPGDGNYSFVLNAQGRIQGDLWAFAGTGELLLETGRHRLAGLMALLDRYIIMDEVELEDVSQSRAAFSVVGPLSAALLETLGLPSGRQPVRQTVVWKGNEVEVIAGYGPFVPRFELWTAVEQAEAFVAGLADAAAALGGGEATDATMEWLRVMEGRPLFGVDIRDKELPQETGQNRALHFAKGCYLGQEIVERIRSRGNVHRQFGVFQLEGPEVVAGAVLEAEGKQVGELTTVSTVRLPSDGETVFGLGYARRDSIERGQRLEYRTNSGSGRAVPVGLPVGRDAIASRVSGITRT